MQRRSWIKAAVVLLLLIMVTEVGLSTRQQSPSWDEGDHIYSGYMNWKNREYSLNPEHPPLAKMLADNPAANTRPAPARSARLTVDTRTRYPLRPCPDPAMAALRSAQASSMAPDWSPALAVV